MSPGTAAQSLKSPASIRSRSVSDSSVPRRGAHCLLAPRAPTKKSQLVTSQIFASTARRDWRGCWGAVGIPNAATHTHLLTVFASIYSWMASCLKRIERKK